MQERINKKKKKRSARIREQIKIRDIRKVINHQVFRLEAYIVSIAASFRAWASTLAHLCSLTPKKPTYNSTWLNEP